MKSYRYKSGAAVLLVVLFFVILSVTLLIGVSAPVMQQIENSSDFFNSKKSYTTADTQAENVLYRLNKGKTDAPSIMSILGSTATAMITDIDGEKQVSTQGVSGEFQRFVKTRFKQDNGVSFNYGLQTGIGGLQIGGSSYIVGNVYSNGDIVGSGASSYISGSATAATISNPIAHIENTSSSTPGDIFNFGSTNTNQDFAQSFVMATTSPITEVYLYMKKVGLPANATVKIVNNSSGVPGATVLTSGTLSASLVTSLYSYIQINMTTSVSFVSGTTYWIVVDVPSNNLSNHYVLGMNNNIFSGNVKQGVSGSSWTDISTTTLDVGFKVFVGGDYGSISNISIGTSGIGNAWARSINNTNVTGSLFCQIGTGNNKACDGSKSDPVASPMPISQGNIDQWKSDATDGGSVGSLSLGSSDDVILGPKRINGDLELKGSSRLNITGPIYVTGDISISGSSKIYVDSSMGSASGIIVTDSIVDISGSGGIYGSGTPGSYVLISSSSDCPTGSGCGGLKAISVRGTAGSVVFSAPNGTVEFSGSVDVKSVVAKQLIMSGSSNITYESGLADVDFTSGPSGSWTISSWKESLGL